jgi:hypothetical protein
MPAAVEVALVELRLAHPSWGPRRLSFELGRRGVAPTVSESAAYRALARLNLIEPAARRPRGRRWKRWERGAAMQLWQMDVVGGFALADGSRAKALTGVDDHSRRGHRLHGTGGRVKPGRWSWRTATGQIHMQQATSCRRTSV